MWSFLRHLNYYKKKFFCFFFQTYTRMSGININFDGKKINKSNFYKNKKLFSTYEIDVNKILISKKRTLR